MTPQSATRIEVRSPMACILCGRVIAEAYGRQTRGLERIRVADPANIEHVKRRRCPTCRGRLLLTDVFEVLVVDRSPLPAEDAQTRRGRPPKAVS